MEFRRYIISFLIFSISLFLVLSISFLNEDMREAIDLVGYAYVGLSAISILTFVISEILVSKDNRGALLQLTMSNTMLKIVFTVVIIYVYYNIKNPSTGLFVVPYILVYIGFTIFEIFFLNSQTKK